MGANSELAKTFRALHRPEAGILIAPTVGDAATARVCQESGARTVLTASGNCGNALGYADGEDFLPAEEALRMIRRIAAVVSIPVSADIEAGYGDPVGFAEAVIEAGVVGVNLEDHVGEESAPLQIEEAASRVAAVREAAERVGFPLFINARTETIIRGGDLEDAVVRLNAYLEAGADCALPMLPLGLRTKETVATLVGRINGPVNLTGYPPNLTIAELEALGVRRVSIPIFVAVHGYTKSLMERVLEERSLEPLKEQEPYMEVNRIFRQLQGGSSGGDVASLLAEDGSIGAEHLP